ncbi:MAG: hypothetical protein RLZZ337_1301 [Bacteroidota bacterium]|jgi:hypothetical protein
MIVYNVTLSINPELETEVLTWLEKEHIPEVMATNLFLNHNMFKILESPRAQTHNSYAIQYHLESWEKFDEYTNEHADKLRTKTQEKFGDNVLAFRTFLEKI